MNIATLAVWAEQWRQPLCKWIRSRNMVPPSEIDDLAQEVFVRLLKYSDEELVTNPQAYLFTIASHVASEWRELARNRYSHMAEWLDELQIDENATPEMHWQHEDVSRVVRRAVDHLPKRRRDVLLLHINDGLTGKQISERLGITYRMVTRDLTYAYGQLRVALVSIGPQFLCTRIQL